MFGWEAEFWFRCYADVSKGYGLATCGLSDTKVSLVGLEGLSIYVLYNTKSVRILAFCKLTILCFLFFLDFSK
jgi:hypothetical protein